MSNSNRVQGSMLKGPDNTVMYTNGRKLITWDMFNNT